MKYHRFTPSGCKYLDNKTLKSIKTYLKSNLFFQSNFFFAWNIWLNISFWFRISQFYSILTSSIDVIYKFCDRIPGYNELQKPDRELLFRSSCLQLFTLRLAHRYICNKVCVSLCPQPLSKNKLLKLKNICNKNTESVPFSVYTVRNRKEKDDIKAIIKYIWFCYSYSHIIKTTGATRSQSRSIGYT